MIGALLLLLAAQADIAITQANCHRWEAPEWAPWEMKSLDAGGVGAPRPPIVFSERAIVPHENAVLWLTKQNDRWGYVGWRRDLDISKDWLYQDGKLGVAELPEDAADFYLQAVSDNDEGAAEKHCTHRAWTAKRFGLRTILRNTIKGQAELRRIALSMRNHRCHVLLKVAQRGVIKGEFYLLLVKRRKGWLIDGIAEKDEEATRYVEVAPFVPDSAEALRDVVVDAFSQRLSWRIEKLATGSFREGFYALYLKGPLPAAELRVTGNSATFGALTLIKHRTGWRVAGAAK